MSDDDTTEMSEDDTTVFWLVPENKRALDIVQNEMNAKYRDTIPAASAANPICKCPGVVPGGVVDCLRIRADHERASDTLVRFGANLLLANIFMTDSANRHLRADIYIDRKTLDVILRDYSRSDTSAGRTQLWFDDHSGPVGKWTAVNGRLLTQVILPSSDPLLELNDANFTFRWQAPEKLQAIKQAFISRYSGLRPVSPFHDICDAQLPHFKYAPRTMEPVTLMKLPFDVRHLILKCLVFVGNVEPNVSTKEFAADLEAWLMDWDTVRKWYNVNGCISLLDYSNQLLDPSYSSHELAIEAATIFYQKNTFVLEFIGLPCFSWCLGQMPSLAPFDARAEIAHMRLQIDGAVLCIMDRGGFTYEEDELVDNMKKELEKSCTVLVSNFPALKHVELYIEDEYTVDSSDESDEEDNIAQGIIPSAISETIDPIVKRIKGEGQRTVKVVYLPQPLW